MKYTERSLIALCLALVLFTCYTFYLGHNRTQLFNIVGNVNITSGGVKTREANLSLDTATDATEYINIYNLTKEDSIDFNCIDMQTNPSTPVCLHSVYDDMYISHDLKETGLWEPHILDDFQDSLNRDPSMGLIDLGANIGVYTLLAAAMGRSVVAVEPYEPNLERLKAAATKAHSINKILLLKNAISDKFGNATIIRNGQNQGDTQVRQGVLPCTGSCPEVVNTITMDSLLNVITFKRALIKLDIQGYEHLAFTHSYQLLTTLFIPYIYMEWLAMAQYFVSADHQSSDKSLVESLIQQLSLLHYVPYSLNSAGADSLQSVNWWKWPNDIVWRLLPMDSEKSQILRNHYKVWP